LFAKRPGDRVRVEVARNGDRRTVEMTLAERPQ
jgi:S1-C subfamily serine protease